MAVTIEGAYIPIASAAQKLATTRLRVLMLLKNKELTGCLVEGEWHVEERSLACLKSSGIGPLERGGCAACTASACGCK